MSKINREFFNVLGDERVAKTLISLHSEASRFNFKMVGSIVRNFPHMISKKDSHCNKMSERFADFFLSVRPECGIYCYQTARAICAKNIVEFGTSFGVSTIYLALAVRDNGGGKVIGTEIIPSKAEKAFEHLKQAGLDKFVEIRVGDARQTLQTLDVAVDMFLNDGFPQLELPVLQIIAPKMRKGSVVLAGNTGYFPDTCKDYLQWVRDPGNGFCSSQLSKSLGEFSVKI